MVSRCLQHIVLPFAAVCVVINPISRNMANFAKHSSLYFKKIGQNQGQLNCNFKMWILCSSLFWNSQKSQIYWNNKVVQLLFLYRSERILNCNFSACRLLRYGILSIHIHKKMGRTRCNKKYHMSKCQALVSPNMLSYKIYC